MSYHSLLESDEVKAIANCLKKNFTLQSLDASSCNIKLSAANMFAGVIRKNNGLYSLNLSENAHDNYLKFNMTMLVAMHFNKNIVYLGLPFN